MIAPSERACPVCGDVRHSLFCEEKIDADKITELTYASRKEPEFMRLRLVRCKVCDVVYAPSPPDNLFLDQAYTEAAYNSDEEARYAARSYAKALEPYIALMPKKCDAVDVGAGNGALLPLLRQQGFSGVYGIEPSQAAIDAGPEAVRPFLRQGLFTKESVADLRLSLVCSFMTLEHMLEPGYFVKAAYELLEPGGLLAVIVHNYQGALNRLLGMRSPIMDIEHLQLFCPQAAQTLLRNAGFEDVTLQPLRNTYPLRYWLRLTPLPQAAKKALTGTLEALGLSRLSLSCRVGNLLAVGKKTQEGSALPWTT